MPLFNRRKIGLFKTETTYNTNSSPVVGTDALLMRKLDITPIQAKTASRNLIRPFFGENDVLVTAQQAGLALEMEMAGTPSAGVAFAPLTALMACSGMAQTVVASTSVTYNPISTNIGSLTSIFNLDGVQHVITGARGSFKAKIAQEDIPTFAFDLTGNFSQPTSVAMGTPVFTQRMPVAASSVNTTLSLFGNSTFKMLSFEFDLGNQIEVLHFANAVDEVMIVDRKVKAKLVLEAISPAVRNFFADLVNTTNGAFNLTHGATTGNRVEFAAPRVSIANATYGDLNGVATIELDLNFTPNTGNDDFTLRFF